MRIKRLIACLLAAATLAGMLVFPASAAKLSAFTDITDPKVAEAAEVLRVLDVVDGTGGGAFNPGRTLTRAEFCKMVIEITVSYTHLYLPSLTEYFTKVSSVPRVLVSTVSMVPSMCSSMA